MALGNRLQLLPQFLITGLHTAAIVDTGAGDLEQRTRAAE
jgi:hypothetical protein